MKEKESSFNGMTSWSPVTLDSVMPIKELFPSISTPKLTVKVDGKACTKDDMHVLQQANEVAENFHSHGKIDRASSDDAISISGDEPDEKLDDRVRDNVTRTRDVKKVLHEATVELPKLTVEVDGKVDTKDNMHASQQENEEAENFHLHGNSSPSTSKETQEDNTLNNRNILNSTEIDRAMFVSLHKFATTAKKKNDSHDVATPTTGNTQK